MRSAIFTLFMSVFLLGCTAKNYPIKMSMAPAIQDQNFGVIVISTGAKESSVASARNLNIIDSTKNQVIASLPIDNYMLVSHFKEHMGFVNAVALPAGDYHVAFTVLNPYLRAKNPEKLPSFTLKPGEHIYLGELYTVDDDEMLEVNDKKERDLELIRKNEPTLSDKAFETRLLNR